MRVPLLEVWQGEEDLHDGIEVAGVSQVGHPSVAGAIARHQLLARLLDDAPLPNTHVHVNLQLRHGGIGLHGGWTKH